MATVENVYMWYFGARGIQPNQSQEVCLVRIRFGDRSGELREGKLPMLFSVWPHVPGNEVVYLGNQL